MRGGRAYGGGRGYRTRYSYGRSGWPWRTGWGSFYGAEPVDPQLVLWAQSCLTQSIGSWVPQTGTLGPATRRALRLFQSQQQLPPTGLPDSDTIVALKKSCVRQLGSGGNADPVFTPGVAPSDGPTSEVSPPPKPAIEGNVSGRQLRTDYTPTPVIDARYMQAVKRGDKANYRVYPIVVPFERDFDRFAARVAYALRDKLYYRHDGGKNARGLVRATGDLKVIHSLYSTGTPPPAIGTPIELNAIFGRRQDPRAPMRWVMVIRFNDSKGWGFVDVKDPDVIVADPASLPRKQMDTMLTQARLDCQALQTQGNRGKRICEMVNIAGRLKYPKNWNLWYYNRALVNSYVDWHTRNARRKEMTRTTGGKLPFDGEGSLALGEWRIYPFREAAIRCAGQSDASCRASIHNALVRAEDEMGRTFADMVQKFSVDSAGLFGPLVEEFRQHLVNLQRAQDSLYLAFGKYPN
jgi:peptidoglycan hydrolase-like protein with peptidoglycan-binding domain